MLRKCHTLQEQSQFVSVKFSKSDSQHVIKVTLVLETWNWYHTCLQFSYVYYSTYYTYSEGIHQKCRYLYGKKICGSSEDYPSVGTVPMYTERFRVPVGTYYPRIFAIFVHSISISVQYSYIYRLGKPTHLESNPTCLCFIPIRFIKLFSWYFFTWKMEKFPRKFEKALVG